MKALLSVLKNNPKIASALAGLGVGGVAGVAAEKGRKRGPDGAILAALEPGSKDHLDELLAQRGYPFRGEDLRSIQRKQ